MNDPGGALSNGSSRPCVRAIASQELEIDESEDTRHAPHALGSPSNEIYDCEPFPEDRDTIQNLHIVPDNCEPFEVPEPEIMHKVPCTGVITYKNDGNPYEKCAGNVDWTTSESTLKCIDLSTPPKRWVITTTGDEVHCWDTPSRTRSKTLLSWQTLPENVSFDAKDLTDDGPGPAWSCLGQSTLHNGLTPTIKFARKACPLRKVGRHCGGSIVHDFALMDGNHYLDQQPSSFTIVRKRRRV